MPLNFPLLPTRFWEKTEQQGDCVVWMGAKSAYGHGQFGISQPGKTRYVHRIVYEAVNGPVPDGLELDHLCRTPACINPAHLEAVTHRENVLRGEGLAAQQVKRTHCPQGHPYSAKNTYRDKKNKRYCRTCGRIAARRRYAARLGGQG